LPGYASGINQSRKKQREQNDKQRSQARKTSSVAKNLPLGNRHIRTLAKTQNQL
jgi:hypothetical protein